MMDFQSKIQLQQYNHRQFFIINQSINRQSMFISYDLRVKTAHNYQKKHQILSQNYKSDAVNSHKAPTSVIFDKSIKPPPQPKRKIFTLINFIGLILTFLVLIGLACLVLKDNGKNLQNQTSQSHEKIISAAGSNQDSNQGSNQASNSGGSPSSKSSNNGKPLPKSGLVTKNFISGSGSGDQGDRGGDEDDSKKDQKKQSNGGTDTDEQSQDKSEQEQEDSNNQDGVWSFPEKMDGPPNVGIAQP